MKDGRPSLGCAPNWSTVDIMSSGPQEAVSEYTAGAVMLSNSRSESMKWHVRIDVMLQVDGVSGTKEGANQDGGTNSRTHGSMNVSMNAAAFRTSSGSWHNI